MKKIEVTNPFDQSLVGTVEIMDDRAVELSLAKAFSLSTKMRHGLSKHLRISILKKTAEIMRSRASKLALLIAEEGGKPLQDAIVEVDRAIDGVETCVSEIGSLTGNEVAMGLTEASSNKIAFTTKEPIGVVLAISAFNHPLNLIVHQVAPAVATGCPVLVKPADDTPLSCRKFVEILLEAGLPEGWAQFVYCSIENAERLVKDERVAFLSFIGSARVGWKLRSLVAPGTQVALEHEERSSACWINGANEKDRAKNC